MVLFSVIAVLVSAVMGHVAGWIVSFGPWPSMVHQYVNSTMYPVLGFYNDTAVVTFTKDVVDSHVRLITVPLMTGVVALIAVTYGYSTWPKKEKSIAATGFVIMVVGLIAAAWIYIISGVGNYPVPKFFGSGVNGIKADDLLTGLTGFGAVFVLLALLIRSTKMKTEDGTMLLRDPLFLSLIAAWIFIYAVMILTGYYIGLNRTFYFGAGAAFDAAYTRFHQDYASFLLPAIVTCILILETFKISGKFRKTVGYLFLSGIVITFVFGWIYSMVALDTAFLYLAIFGVGLVLLGGLAGAEYLRRTGTGIGT